MNVDVVKRLLLVLGLVALSISQSSGGKPKTAFSENGDYIGTFNEDGTPVHGWGAFDAEARHAADSEDAFEDSLVRKVLHALESGNYHMILAYSVDHLDNWYGKKSASASYVEADIKEASKKFPFKIFTPIQNSFKTEAEYSSIGSHQTTYESIDFDWEVSSETNNPTKTKRGRSRLSIVYGNRTGSENPPHLDSVSERRIN